MIWYIYGLMGLILAKSTIDWYRYERPNAPRRKMKKRF